MASPTSRLAGAILDGARLTLLMAGLVILPGTSQSQTLVMDGLKDCVRADNGRPVCIMVATGRFTFVPDEVLQRYQRLARAVPAPMVAPQQAGIGPTFDCGRAVDILLQIVCQDAGLRRLDVEMNQAFYALRFAIQDEIPRLRNDATVHYRETLQGCGLQGRPPLTADLVQRTRQCIASYNQRRRDSLMRELSTMPPEVNQEARRTPEEHWRLQARLVEIGLLPSDTQIDGALGSSSRSAIIEFQRQRGLPQTGFLSVSTAQGLLQSGRLQSAQAEAPRVTPFQAAQTEPFRAPVPIIAPSAPSRPISVNLQRLTQGNPADLLAMINVAPGAPSASRDIDGNIVFRTSRPELCQASDIGSDAARSFAVEAWLQARRVVHSVAAITGCQGRDFRAMDVAFVRRGEIATMEARFHGSLSVAADASTMEVQILEDAGQRESADATRAAARLETARAVAARHPGASYLVFANGSSRACYVAEDNAAAWQSAIDGRSQEFQLDLRSRLPLNSVQLGLNDAFIAVRRGECRVIVGEAGSLSRIEVAVRRESLSGEFGAIWLGILGTGSQSGGMVTAGPNGAPAERLQSPFTAGLEGRGSPGDLLLLVNVGNGAPNATTNLSGDVVFLSSRASICIVAGLQASLAQQLALEDWFRDRRATFSAVSANTCGNGEFSLLDGVLLRRGELARLDIALYNSIVRAASSRGVREEIVLAEASNDAQRNRVAEMVARNGQWIEANRDGHGLVGFPVRSGQVCIVGQEVGQPVWSRLFQSSQRELQVELDQRGPLELAYMDADAAYIAARRGSCRLILAPAGTLRAVLAASQRDGLTAMVQAIWFSAAQASAAQREIDANQTAQQRQRQAEEQAAQQERAQREIRDRNLGVERARRTEAMRNAARPRAVALQDQVKNGVSTLFAGNQEPNLVGSQLSGLRSVALRRRSEGWELQTVEAAVADFGTSQWSGRVLPSVVIEVTVRLRNAAIGRYETLCFLTAHQEDVEFNRIRDVLATDCGSSGSSLISDWLTSRSFESQWIAR